MEKKVKKWPLYNLATAVPKDKNESQSSIRMIFNAFIDTYCIFRKDTAAKVTGIMHTYGKVEEGGRMWKNVVRTTY